MHTGASIVTLAAEGESHLELAMHTLPYGLLAAGVFAVLALITASYSNVAHRHEKPAHHEDDKH